MQSTSLLGSPCSFFIISDVLNLSSFSLLRVPFFFFIFVFPFALYVSSFCSVFFFVIVFPYYLCSSLRTYSFFFVSRRYVLAVYASSCSFILFLHILLVSPHSFFYSRRVASFDFYSFMCFSCSLHACLYFPFTDPCFSFFFFVFLLACSLRSSLYFLFPFPCLCLFRFLLCIQRDSFPLFYFRVPSSLQSTFDSLLLASFSVSFLFPRSSVYSRRLFSFCSFRVSSSLQSTFVCLLPCSLRLFNFPPSLSSYYLVSSRRLSSVSSLCACVFLLPCSI